ncbi:MAG: lysostaphin resistance A-like protein [Bacteroidota bacterium]
MWTNAARELPGQGWMKARRWAAWFLLFLANGLLVFIVFSHYYPLLGGTADGIGRVIIAAGFLGAAVIAWRSERLMKYWPIPFAFFTGLTAISIDYYFSVSRWIIPALGVQARSPEGWAIEKLESSLLGILVVLTLTRLSGQRLESLYLRRGNLRLGLIVGLAAFSIMFVTTIPVAEMYFKGQNLSWARLLPWTPWLFIFVLANASNEELIFRGLFLGKAEPFLGRFGANLVTAITFTLMHSFVNYATNTMIFLTLQTLPAALVWGWLMQKTNSIWGSILFHAAMDIPIIVGIFSTL